MEVHSASSIYGRISKGEVKRDMPANLIYSQADKAFRQQLREWTPDLDAIMALTEGVVGFCVKSEMPLLAYAARIAPQGAIVELGALQGYTTIVLASIAKQRGLRVFSIDDFFEGADPPASDCPWLPPVSAEIVERNVAPVGADVTVVSGKSHVVPDGVDEVGLLFIDSDHRGPWLTRELDAWLPLMTPGGVIVLHDYCDDYPKYAGYVDVINERLGAAPEWQFVALVRYMIMFQKVK